MGRSALCIAAFEGSIVNLKKLLNAGALEFLTEKDTPIKWALLAKDRPTKTQAVIILFNEIIEREESLCDNFCDQFGVITLEEVQTNTPHFYFLHLNRVSLNSGM